MVNYIISNKDHEYLQSKFENIQLMQSRGITYNLTMTEIKNILSILQNAQKQK